MGRQKIDWSYLSKSAHIYSKYTYLFNILLLIEDTK